MTTLTVRTRRLRTDGSGNRAWQVRESGTELLPERSAVVLCDVWDRHWCPAAEQRLAAMLPAMNGLIEALREAGALIVHAPSETMGFYAHHPARRRIVEATRRPLAPPAPLDLPPLPIGVGDTHGCDSAADAPSRSVWTRQHPAIGVDPDRDVVTDDGGELFPYLTERDIRTVVVLGVHTNMCILDRSFALKALVRHGFEPMLVRDLTDAMYDPADPPYVQHEEGTALVIEYIEKFLCPTVTCDQLMAARSAGVSTSAGEPASSQGTRTT